MSVFIKSLKTFKSKITGKEQEFKINLAILAFLESEYNLTLEDLSHENTKDLDVAKFVHAVFHANGMETTLQEILENTAAFEMFEFLTDYNMVNNENFTLATNRLKEKAQAKIQKNKKSE